MKTTWRRWHAAGKLMPEEDWLEIVAERAWKTEPSRAHSSGQVVFTMLSNCVGLRAPGWEHTCSSRPATPATTSWVACRLHLRHSNEAIRCLVSDRHKTILPRKSLLSFLFWIHGSRGRYHFNFCTILLVFSYSASVWPKDVHYILALVIRQSHIPPPAT